MSGAGKRSACGIRASVSVSSGAMWMNCAAVQQAVQPPQGTSDPRSPRSAARIPASHAEKSPAARASSSAN